MEWLVPAVQSRRAMGGSQSHALGIPPVRTLPDETYLTRLARRVDEYRQKWPEKHAKILQDARSALFPISWQDRPLESLPRVAQMALEEEVRERVRVQMGWPDEKSFLVHS